MLDRNIIKISSKIIEYKLANAIEEKTKTQISYNVAELYLIEVFWNLDNVC